MTREQLDLSILSNMPTNGIGYITAAHTRAVATDMADYIDEQIDDTTDRIEQQIDDIEAEIAEYPEMINGKLNLVTEPTNAGNIDKDGAYNNIISGRRNWINSTDNGIVLSLDGMQIAVDISGRIYSRNMLNANWNLCNQLVSTTETDANKLTYPSVVGYQIITNSPDDSLNHHWDVYTFTSADLDGNQWRSIIQIALDRDTTKYYMRTQYAQLGDQAPYFNTPWVSLATDLTPIQNEINNLNLLIPRSVTYSSQTVNFKNNTSNILFSIGPATSGIAGVMTANDKTKLNSAVTSTTTGLKIEVVSQMPANPDANTMYVVL